MSYDEKILEFNVGVLNMVVFLRKWVKTNYIGNSVIAKRDEFTHVDSLIPISN
jgi:hypothetical protein